MTTQATASSLPRKDAEQAGFLRKTPPSPCKLLNVGPSGANCGLGRLRKNYSGAGVCAITAHAHAHSVPVTVRGGGKRGTGERVYACVSRRDRL